MHVNNVQSSCIFLSYITEVYTNVQSSKVNTCWGIKYTNTFLDYITLNISFCIAVVPNVIYRTYATVSKILFNNAP